MLRVDNWLDVVSLENMEEDHSFLFLKKNLMKIFFFFEKFGNPEFLFYEFFFLKELKILINNFFFIENFGNLEFFQRIENFDWFFLFLESNLRSTSPMPLVLMPFLKISFFFFFFFEIWRFVHYQKVKKMKIKME